MDEHGQVWCSPIPSRLTKKPHQPWCWKYRFLQWWRYFKEHKEYREVFYSEECSEDPYFIATLPSFLLFPPTRRAQGSVHWEMQRLSPGHNLLEFVLMEKPLAGWAGGGWYHCCLINVKCNLLGSYLNTLHSLFQPGKFLLSFNNHISEAAGRQKYLPRETDAWGLMLSKCEHNFLHFTPLLYRCVASAM